MRVIFVKDVARVGKRDEVREIADGYALNFLIPRGVALQATPERLSALKQRLERESAQHAQDAAKVAEALKSLDGASVFLDVATNKQGHLFSAIQETAIAQAIAKQTGAAIAAEMIRLTNPIKHTGEHGIEIKSGNAAAHVVLVVRAKA